MDRVRLPQNSDLFQEDGFWKLRCREDSFDEYGHKVGHLGEPVLLGPATGSGRLTQNEAQRVAWIAWNHFLPRLRHETLALQSKMTVAEFVEHKFVPEHVTAMRYSGRAHYQAILKHVLTPEEADRVFEFDENRTKTKLKTVPDWPYLSNLRLCDARPDHIQALVSAALARGYAPQTAVHIRNVVSAIFSHAKQEQCFLGQNPASLVRVAESNRKDAHTLTFSETKEAIGAMEYPEKEMTLIAILTGMNVVEICGLQWKYVNLSLMQRNTDDETIAPRTIAVRKQWYRGELGTVKKCRSRNLPIPQPLLQILQRLRGRTNFTGPDDFVVVSRVGTPVNQTNILERRLKPIAKQVQVPSLSWHVFRRTRKALTSELGELFEYYVTAMVRSGSERETGTEQLWHCRTQQRQSYLGQE